MCVEVTLTPLHLQQSVPVNDCLHQLSIPETLYESLVLITDSESDPENLTVDQQLTFQHSAQLWNY